MTVPSSLNVWLAYVAFPVTSAVYIERALRRICRVTSIGPRFPEERLIKWQIENLNLPLRDQDIPTEFEPDMRALLDATPVAEQPDLYIWVESVMGHFPEHLEALSCPTACYLIDSHLSNLTWHLEWGKKFDLVFVAQREYVEQFRAQGMNAHWLPLGCDPDIHGKQETPKKHDVTFVGSTMFNPRRSVLLESLEATVPFYRERSYWTEMAHTFSASKVIFNCAVKHDLNMRVFEALCTGSLLLTDCARGSGLEQLFHDGEDLALYRCDAELADMAQFYLNNPDLREQIAERGRQVVLRAHTYAHRAEDLLAVVRGEKATTLSAEELRERSIEGLDEPFSSYTAPRISMSAEQRSFVIPVLDYSPASEFNIATLLRDLEQISGEVLVVFNDEAVAAELKGHPRITRSAIMTENVGVARAWNVGIEMATTPYVFILNADLHLEPHAVEVMEQGLRTLDQAACVGPQGSFINFRLTRDFIYFNQGDTASPVVVDAVSGFLFAVKREHFGPGGLRFENAFTPCYFEEWDIGLQIKRAGLKSYVVPTTAYTHHWSGSIAARREIDFMGRSETPQDILRRNRVMFLAKWRREGADLLSDSGIGVYVRRVTLELLRAGKKEEAKQTVQHFAAAAPCRTDILCLAGFVMGHLEHHVEAIPYFKRALKIDASLDMDLFMRDVIAELTTASPCNVAQ